VPKLSAKRQLALPAHQFRTAGIEPDGECQGFGPIQFVQKLKNSWRLEKTEVASLLGCGPEDAEYVSDILDGKAQPRGRDIQDRIAHLFSIRRTLWSLFRDLDVENEWLRENHPILNGKSPLSLIIEGSMEDLLLAREYVETAAGVR